MWWTATFRCDCSFCRKTRFWKGFAPASDFRLIAGAGALTDYRFGEGEIAHTFCRVCGVCPFVTSSLPQMGGDFTCVNLAAAPVISGNGRNDAWSRPPAISAHL